MPKKITYRLFYSGKISEGFSVKSVLHFFVKFQKMPKENLQRVARRERVLIFSTEEYEEVIQIDKEMRSNGAICELEIIEGQEINEKEKTSNKSAYQKLLLILLSLTATYLLIFDPLTSFMTTIFISFLFIYPIILEKEKHMMLFHNDKHTKSKIIQRMLSAFLIILFTGISTTSITCMAVYSSNIESNLLNIFIFISILMSIILFMNSYKKLNDAKKSIIKVYYKKSLIVGLLFSIASSFIIESTLKYEPTKDLLKGNLCGAVYTLNYISVAIFKFLPPPYDSIISEIFSFNIVSGYIFVTYGIAIYSISNYIIYRDSNVFIWKKNIYKQNQTQ